MTFLYISLFYGLTFIAIIIPTLVAVAVLTLLERKVMASAQRRVGPNRVGFFGILQPFADGLKIIFKDTIFPKNIFFGPFIFGPLFIFVFSFLPLGFIPLGRHISVFSHSYSMLIILICLSFGLYGVIAAGWASNSKYALLGCLRALSQMIAYELCLTTSLASIMLITGTLNIHMVVIFQIECTWLIVPCFPCFVLIFISLLAESYRIPFDLPEAEGELVAGVHVEYSAVLFAFFYLGEYTSLIFMSMFISSIFLGGYELFGYESCFFLVLKTTAVVHLFLVTRAALPRYRYDQLLDLGWRILFPCSISLFLWYASLSLVIF